MSAEQQNPKLSHVDDSGAANMVDVSEKSVTKRVAIASGQITMQASTLALIKDNGLQKGDVLATARIAGIMAAKRTSDLIPLCHPLMLSKVSVEFELDGNLPGIRIEVMAQVSGQTGVEMEALTAASVACLTIYDMAKGVDRGMVISNIQVMEKSGGKSGHWRRDADSGFQQK